MNCVSQSKGTMSQLKGQICLFSLFVQKKLQTSPPSLVSVPKLFYNKWSNLTKTNGDVQGLNFLKYNCPGL